MYLVTKGFFLNKEAKVSGPVVLHIHFWYSYGGACGHIWFMFIVYVHKETLLLN